MARISLDISDGMRVTDPQARAQNVMRSFRAVGSPSFNAAAEQLERIFFYAPKRCSSCGV
jgi:hypothetical protein